MITSIHKRTTVTDPVVAVEYVAITDFENANVDGKRVFIIQETYAEDFKAFSTVFYQGFIDKILEEEESVDFFSIPSVIQICLIKEVSRFFNHASILD